MLKPGHSHLKKQNKQKTEVKRGYLKQNQIQKVIQIISFPKCWSPLDTQSCKLKICPQTTSSPPELLLKQSSGISHSSDLARWDKTRQKEDTHRHLDSMLTRPWDTISFCRSLDFSSNTLIAWNSQHAQNPAYKHAQHCLSESPWLTTAIPSACVNWFLFARIFMSSKNPQDHPHNPRPRWP